MSLALYASPYQENINEKNEKNNIDSKKISRNKTLKNKNEKPVETMMNFMKNGFENNEGDGLNDFKPPPHPEISSKNVDGNIPQISEYKDTLNMPKPYISSDNEVDANNFNSLESYIPEEYYQSRIPNYSTMNSAIGDKNAELISKLDQILHLLQESHDEKTGHVAEELILYSFLGIFIIFIIDSFARAGKYVR